MKIKTILLGDRCTGKSHLLSHLRTTPTKHMYIPTIGVDVVAYSKSGTTLQVWDTSGSNKFQAVVRSFLRGASLCIIVYNSKRSLAKVASYISTVDTLCERDYRTFIVCLSSDEDIVYDGEMIATRNRIPFYHCDPFDRVHSIGFWHDVMHRCESYVNNNGWKVDIDTPTMTIHQPRGFWEKFCFWR